MNSDHTQYQRDSKKPVNRTVGSHILAGLLACLVLAPTATATTSGYVDTKIDGFINPVSLSFLSRESTDEPVVVSRKARYHNRVADLELEQAVNRAARQHQVQPALLLAVMKAESSFNPTVVSKAGAVGLMQLIPETAIRHGVRNLYDTNENISGGAKHLRYLLDRFHGNIRLALAAYNAGERKVDLYGKIPPYKETQDYVKKVIGYYRSYRQEGWIMPVATAVIHGGQLS